MTTKIKLIIAILLMGLSSAIASADDKPKSQNPDRPKEVDFQLKKKPQPHTPGFENEVTGLLDGQILTITFAEPEGMARVSLREGGVQTVYTGFHATAAPIVLSVPATDVPVQIYIKTQSNEYEGWIE